MRRAFIQSLFALIVLVSVIFIAGIWLLKTDEGLQFVLQQTRNWLGKNTTQVLDVQEVQGNIWNGFSAGKLTWQNDNQAVVANGVVLRWQLAGLFRVERVNRQLVFDEFSVESIQASVPASEDNTPITLPEKIELPIDIQLNRLAIGQLSFNEHTIDAIQARADLKSGRLDLHQLDATFQQSGLKSRLGMVLSKPYVLNGQLFAEREFENLALNSELILKGSLERLELLLSAAGRDNQKLQLVQSAEASAVVTPFLPAMVEYLKISTTDFNPAQWLQAAPKAMLTINANIQPNEDFTASRGSFVVRNKLPLTIQQGGIPVEVLNSSFNLQLKQQPKGSRVIQQFDLELKEMLFADGRRPAGRAAGTVTWKAPNAVAKQGQDNNEFDFTQGSTEFSIQTKALNAAVFAQLPKPIALNTDVQGIYKQDNLRFSKLLVQDRKAELSGTLSASLAGRRPIELSLNFIRVNPADYVPNSNLFLEGDLNGNVFFKGNLTASGSAFKLDPDGQLALNLDNSSLANAPLKLKAKATGNSQQLRDVLLDLDVVGNTVKAEGAYGTATDFVNFDARLAQLPRLGKLMDMKLAGNAQASGRLQAFNGDFSGQLKVLVDRLKLDQVIEIESVLADVSLGSAPSSPWVGRFQVSKLKQAGATYNLINEISAQLKGTRSQHQLVAQFTSGLTTFSRSRPLKGEFALQGGIKPLSKVKSTPTGWQGALNSLKVEGLWLPARSLTLQKPAPLIVAPGLVELIDLTIKGEDSSVLNNRLLRVASNEVSVEGEMPQFSFPRMSPILRKQLTVEPLNLIAKVAWRYISTPSKVDGHIDLTHVSGGLQVLEDSQIDVKIRQMKANLDFNREAAKLDLNIDADEFGLLTANLKLPVSQNPQTKAWGLAGNEKMEGAVAASFTELNWLGPMISGGIRTSGTGQIAMAIGGTVNNPDVQGRLFGMGLNVFQLDQGVRLEEGNVVVDFTTDKASIDTFEFTVFNRQAPRRQIEKLGPLIQGNGKITAQGQWNLTGLDGEIRVNLDKVPLLQRTDRWLLINSKATVQQPKAQGQALTIRGEVNALGAYFEMPESGPQTLSDDVFIQGRSEVAAAGIPIDLQLQANLGDRFYLNAAGLRTRLTGGLRLVMLDGVGGSGQRRSGRRLTANGTIQAEDGIYRAYGQDLTIDRGVVNFQGPLDNPGLNVRAVRKGVAVEAGVEVTGTAQRPKITLVSDPAVPDSEKLSWMIIGRGSNSADRDSTLLLTAAAAIFGDEDESTTRKIARSVGIDELTLSTGSLTAADSRAVGSKVAVAPGADASANIIGSDDPLLSQRIISLGKRFSDQVYLSFDQSVTTTASILKFNYQYSRQLSFIARTGADNAVDMLYQLSFD
ncbi:MAG: translocation/assembly module TamB domain-containing protein [Burkholderiales bacterium]|uniref:translocation/assembly module TamB domain-containing protein n=1 Tax=Limnobacter sp. TaxID=2003368 RepID=UPI0039BC476C|nr:translocation/assembly module TamB domain-containing protein [Burkholderiales bacterium]